MENEVKKIKCPKCKREYLPNEIYMPKSFLGEAKNIVRDEKGKIEFYTNESMDLYEEYVCECGCEFKVIANVDFQTKEINEDFEDFVQHITPEKEDLF